MYRDPKLVGDLARSIESISHRPVTLMEVCGSHTMAIQRFGIRSLLPDKIRLISGPGCPVCVTDIGFIDTVCAMASRNDVMITTFGDLIRVPGSDSSLEQERARGADIRVVQSSLEALRLARDNPGREVVFLGIGFETTAPTTAAAIQAAANQEVGNFSVLSAHKTMKPAMLALISDGVAIDGYICPGHVSIVTGADMYREIVDTCQVGCVVAGFEPADILRLRQGNRDYCPLSSRVFAREKKADRNALSRMHASVLASVGSATPPEPSLPQLRKSRKAGEWK